MENFDFWFNKNNKKLKERILNIVNEAISIAKNTSNSIKSIKLEFKNRLNWPKLCSGNQSAHGAAGASTGKATTGRRPPGKSPAKRVTDAGARASRGLVI